MINQLLQLAGGNPLTEGLLAIVAAENPEIVANAAAALGIPPPTSMSQGDDMFSLGAMLDPAMAQSMMASMPAVNTGVGVPQGGYAMGMGAPMAAAGAVPAAGGDPAAGTGDPMAMLKGLQGFKGPEQNKPIMSAGVSGAQKAPEVGGAQNMALSNELIAAILGQGMKGTQAPASLGQYLG